MTQHRLYQDPFHDLFAVERAQDPLACGVCHEQFAEEWMAQRCQAQGYPPLAYRPGELIKRKHDGQSLLLVRQVWIHHARGVKCHVEGPCPHDATYYCLRLNPVWFGPDRAWLASAGDLDAYRQPHPGHEVVGRMTAPWGVTPETGDAERYMAGPEEEERWARLWQLWEEMQPRTARRRPGRRLFR